MLLKKKRREESCTWKKAFSYDPISSVASMRKLRAEGRGWGNSGAGREGKGEREDEGSEDGVGVGKMEEREDEGE